MRYYPQRHRMRVRRARRRPWAIVFVALFLLAALEASLRLGG